MPPRCGRAKLRGENERVRGTAAAVAAVSAVERYATVSATASALVSDKTISRRYARVVYGKADDFARAVTAKTPEENDE